MLHPLRAVNPLLVDESSVTALQVRQQEAIRIGRILHDPGVIAAHQVLPVRIEVDVCAWVPADEDFPEPLERNVFHLIRLHASQVTNDDLLHW